MGYCSQNLILRSVGELLTEEESSKYRELSEALEITEAAIQYRSRDHTLHLSRDSTDTHLPPTEVSLLG